MRKILSLFRPVFEFSAFLFPFVLVLYLILFLLENIFSGFVSNNFDINYFLIPVIFFGFLAAFANKDENPNEDEAKKPTKSDFILIAGLVVLSFVILAYKTADLGLMGFVISLISSFLIALVSLIIIFPLENLDSATEKAEEAIETSKRKLSIPRFNLPRFNLPRFSIPRFNIPEYNYKKIFISPLGLSLTGLILVIIIGGLVFDLYQGKVAEKRRANQQAGSILEKPKVEIPNDQLLSETPILVENGTGKTGKAASIAAFLNDFNFGTVKTGDADNANYKNAYITFNQKDFKVASYITFLLSDNDKYKIVNMLPPANASQSGIILIIGE